MFLDWIWCPGYFDPKVRIIYVILFLFITVTQTYIALRMEDVIASEFDSKYISSEINPLFH